uniref:Casein kinase II subunit beta n=1 Tax=Euplotes harpa TaxID=151035 RepID=A0A7S3N8X6_9SPIT|mmetsp:Transcript_24931/g.28626  ORF Transcript_24931/g.28626 Transcript_24931/m.28626 type:complete len:130 (+) Transcript_24931:349-738(+)
MYMLGKFGTCPRVLCKRHPVLPFGASSELGTSRVKVFCPLCKDVYVPRKGPVEIDGAAFGPSFPHALLLSFTELVVGEGPQSFVPKLYGFKIFGLKGSKYQVTFDEHGNATNKEAVKEILEAKRTDAYD